MKRIICLIICLALLILTGCSTEKVTADSGEKWSLGFAGCEIELPKNSDSPLYIAGYKNGAKITGTLDLQRANALWMDVSDRGYLLIGIDCIALASGTVEEIRTRLKDFCEETGCISVNVFATHTHAGADTLGLWGPIAKDGKNDAFMENLISAAVTAAKNAYEDRSVGRLFYAKTKTATILDDSRFPLSYDPYLYQVRFEPEEDEQNGIRMLFYGAHAESLRGDNRKVSRDYPGVMADIIKKETGDDVLYLPGALGGLIYTADLTNEDIFDAKYNLQLTGEKLANYALSINNEEEQEVSAQIALSTVEITVPLDNTMFMYYKFLGILETEVKSGSGGTGYDVVSTLGVLRLGNLTLALIPGEIFPELINGSNLSITSDPKPLKQIANENGVENLLIVGLCNDELGYIVPPSDFKLNEELPYIAAIDDQSEDHYEETNSVGPDTAFVIAEAFEKALKQLNKTK